MHKCPRLITKNCDQTNEETSTRNCDGVRDKSVIKVLKCKQTKSLSEPIVGLARKSRLPVRVVKVLKNSRMQQNLINGSKIPRFMNKHKHTSAKTQGSEISKMRRSSKKCENNQQTSLKKVSEPFRKTQRYYCCGEDQTSQTSTWRLREVGKIGARRKGRVLALGKR